MKGIIDLIGSLFGFLTKRTEKDIEVIKIKNSEEFVALQRSNRRKEIKDKAASLIKIIKESNDEKEVQQALYSLRLLLAE